MDKIKIIGGTALKGEIPISGAKNAALPLIAAGLLTGETLTLSNVPKLKDVETIITLLRQHGSLIEEFWDNSTITIQSDRVTNYTAPYELVKTMRASILVLGPLLARFGKAKVSLPGGCAIGSRPVDLHLKAMEALGATIELEGGYVLASAPEGLIGAEIAFDTVSVGATENALMAAVFAKGTTRLRNAAREPEITDLAECLVAMGAKIEGIGSSTLEITGVENLHAAEHQVVADRIEAGSFIAAVAITGGEVTLQNVPPRIMGSVLEKFTEAGVGIETDENSIKVTGNGLKGIDIMTQPYPGFPTDMQAQMMALLSLAEGASMITENIFENRYMHVPELVRMGANITVQGRSAIIRGADGFKGAEVMATDLRASLSLVIAALAAEGETIIDRVYHLDRGYEKLEEKLSRVGAKIERI
jgi:UDP-N-acetylglucosamine 1-carboxyvinyltransferase